MYIRKIIGVLVVTGVVTVLIWYALQQVWPMGMTEPVADAQPATSTPAANATTSPVTQQESATDPASGNVSEATSVPVTDLPLTSEQRALAESFGLNIDQMHISNETISCAQEVLGAARYEAVLAGAAPTFLEAAKLLPCTAR